VTGRKPGLLPRTVLLGVERVLRGVYDLPLAGHGGTMAISRATGLIP